MQNVSKPSLAMRFARKLITAKAARLGLSVFAILAFAGGCGPSEEQCRALCDWWIQSCSSETHSSCMNDCAASSQAEAEDAKACIDGSPPALCTTASCCLRFVYEQYGLDLHCGG